MVLGILALCQPWIEVAARLGCHDHACGTDRVFGVLQDQAASGRGLQCCRDDIFTTEFHGMADDRTQRRREVFRRELHHPQAQSRDPATANSSSCLGHRAAARPRRCEPSPVLRISTAAEILIDGKPVQDLQAADRDIAFVFQLFALYPHLTVYENIAFPLRATRESASVIDAASARCCQSLAHRVAS